MNVNHIISEELNKIILNEDSVWYHGTPDARELNSSGGFTPKTDTTDYIPDPEKWHKVQDDMQQARASGDEDQYFKLLDLAGTLRGQKTFRKPIFFTDNHRVASTYSDPHRSFDYQNSEPRLLKTEINDSGKILRVPAHGDRFRGIGVDVVKKAVMDTGISGEEVDKILAMHPNDIRGGVMRTDILAIIAQELGFDIVDVLGVLDSYEGGSIKSTVRMVFDPSRVRIIS